MKVDDPALSKLLSAVDSYTIPVFQRYYVWERKNWDKLWNDLELLMVPDVPYRPHFLGALVFSPIPKNPGEVTRFMVIDGQQRLITIELILCAIRDIAYEKGWDKRAEEIENSYLVHQYKTGKDHYKVYPRLRDRDSYISIIDRQGVLADNKIGEAYNHFLKLLQESTYFGSEKTLLNFLGKFIDGLQFVSISLNAEDPYKIFKSLNYDGVKLAQCDLIRNHVFMLVDPDKQDEFDDQYWSPFEKYFQVESSDTSIKINHKEFDQFFRNFLLKEGKTVLEEYIYESFDNWFTVRGKEPYSVVQEFKRCLEYQKYIDKRKSHSSRDIQNAIDNLSEYKLKTIYPLLFKLLLLNEDGKLSDSDLIKSLKIIDSFVMRRYCCQKSTRQYIDMFVEVCGKLKITPLQDLIDYLNSKGWPDDDEFLTGLYSLQLYKKNFKKVFLGRIEMFLQNPSERVAIERCQLEHIMPKTINIDSPDGQVWITSLGDNWEEIHTKYLDTIGNLTYVGEDYNNSMKNKPFLIKKPVLGSSRVYLNKYFNNPSLINWTNVEIDARAKEMADCAKQIWVKL